jgi:hypothetical protein
VLDGARVRDGEAPAVPQRERDGGGHSEWERDFELRLELKYSEIDFSHTGPFRPGLRNVSMIATVMCGGRESKFLRAM